jgi:hypothetical protein
MLAAICVDDMGYTCHASKILLISSLMMTFDGLGRLLAVKQLLL